MIVQPVLVVANALFLGIYGILVRRNAVMVLLSIELILNSVNINFIMFDTMLANIDAGQIFTIFIITIAAEVGIGLALYYVVGNRQTANINEFDLMKW